MQQKTLKKIDNFKDEAIYIYLSFPLADVKQKTNNHR